MIATGTLDFSELYKAAVVPEHLVPWNKNGRLNAHRIGPHTFLFDVCEAGLHMLDMPEEGYGGYTVMEDSPQEVARHLQAVRYATGRVLKTGLGLGCFVRMCLTKPDVEHVDVIEIDPEIAAHFGAEFVGNPRVTIHIADALAWPVPPAARWDLAWHDVYREGNDGLQVLHVKLMCRFRDYCDRQGAWGLPRFIRRRARRVI